MIKELRVDNFKSLNDFKIEITPFTVVVGNNSTGKSSVLQALSFLSKCMTEEFDAVIEHRGQKVENIKSKIRDKNSKIRFGCVVELLEASEVKTLEWEMDLQVHSSKKMLSLYRERIMDLNSKKTYLKWESGKGGYIGGQELETPLAPLNYKSSIMNVIDEGKSEKLYPEICMLKRFFVNAESFEMLSPDRMRLSSRGNTKTIGSYGDKLPSFIKSMNAEQKERFVAKLHDLLDGRLKEISSATKGKPGWTLLKAVEQYGEHGIAVTSRELSDGMLRLLAFVAISEMDSHTTYMLLDEIENGINSNYSEKLIQIMREITKSKRQQLIVTTHSTVFLDYVEAEEIVYLYRDQDTGFTQATKLFQLKKFQQRLKGLYPGEILLNLTNEQILNEIMRSQ